MMKQLLLLLLSLTLLSPPPARAEREIVPFRLLGENGLPDGNIRNIWQDSTGYIYLSGRYNIYRYDGYNYRMLTKAERESISIERKSRGNVAGNRFYDNLGNAVVLLPNGDIRYTDKHTKEQLQFNVVSPRMFLLTQRLMCTVITDRRGLIWVSTNGGGLVVYDRKKHTSQRYSAASSSLLDTDYIVFMTEDRDGNIWLSGEHHGVICLNIRERNYEVLDVNTTQTEKGNEVRMLCRLSDGRILVADMNGMLRQSVDELQTLQTLVAGGENYIAACLDNEGRLWLGSRLNGLNIDGQHYGEGRIDCILSDSKGRMWVCGLRNGLSLVSLRDGKYTSRPFLKDINDLDPRVMLEDRQGQIWVGTRQGLYVFRPDEIIRNPKAYKKVLPHQVMCLCLSGKQHVWAGTAGQGVFYSEKPSPTANTPFTQIAMKHGLANDNVQFVVEDAKHNLIVGTENGCSFIKPSRRQIYNLFFNDSRLRNICGERCAVLLKDGRMALGTYDDIVITGEMLGNQKKNHPVRLTRIMVNGNDSRGVDMNNLSHDKNSLTFVFSNLAYGDRQLTFYTCRLEGHDREWIDMGRDHEITYKDLPPGRYTLYVKSREMAGDGESQLLLNIRILPPWWATWWAYLIYIITAIAVGYGTYRQLHRVNKLRRAVAVERELTAYKLKFFTNISHEFRTPLTLIQGSMDKLNQLPDVSSSVRAPLSTMQRNVDRMLRLINQLLEFRRMQNNRLSLSLEKTEIVAFVYNIVQTFHDAAEQNVTLTFTPSMKSLDVYIDRGFIDKAVYNLLSNAFKYTPKGGSVAVKLRLKDERLVIVVEDTGVGVPEEMREKIFDRFLHGQINRDSLGIGLDLTAELIRTHHGIIRCEDREGGGSVFTIELPTDKGVYDDKDFLKGGTVEKNAGDNERQGFAEQVREAMPEPMNSHCVLVVEDDPEITAYLKQELGRYFNVETAGNGKEALEMLSFTDCQLIITDVMMPQMNGYELLRHLRKDDRTRHLPVVMLTALGSEDQYFKGLDAGADAYITKPFSLPLLLLQCRNLLRRDDSVKESMVKDEQPFKQKAPEIITDERDQKLLAQLMMYVDSHLADPNLGVDRFAESMGYGRTTFYQKLKALIGQTPNEYIKERRLQRAAELLKDERVTVAEVAYQVGMSTPQYLSTIFKKRFGVTPTQYQKGKNSED